VKICTCKLGTRPTPNLKGAAIRLVVMCAFMLKKKSIVWAFERQRGFPYRFLLGSYIKKYVQAKD